MNEKEEELLNEFFDGKIKEDELNENCKKIINIYRNIIKTYFSCENSVINNVKSKLNFR
ncbi:hypothetical protein X928_08420 [Petrotoga miotherma DSM 10691]|uniref:Uncharacterized protein n=1 Tax=Petrotoga miotherma DSM 10691 TaxID=1434326 RepID=A0A2K1P885_9BACT|nr:MULTISPECIES: hypothetical protein [Petrotoga]PNR99000.1 hypothetical protein X928_08420 [Petrotoga miotherma DSM 10691]